LRKVYMDGPVGVNSLKTYYGGKKDRGTSPEKFRQGSGAVLEEHYTSSKTQDMFAKLEKEDL